MIIDILCPRLVDPIWEVEPNFNYPQADPPITGCTNITLDSYICRTDDPTKASLRTDEGPVPAPGFVLPEDGTTCEDALHDYVFTPRGVFSLLLCCASNIDRRYGVKVSQINGTTGMMSKDNIDIPFYYDDKGVMINGTIYSSLNEAVNFIENVFKA